MDNKAKILVVDDSSGNKLLLQYSLEGLFTLDFANSGESAINKFKSNTYDLILMDIHMPNMDGVETTLKIRAMENGHHTPIFAVTANVLPTQKIKCLEAGMDDYITKPINAKALMDHIVNYLDNPL